MGLKMQCIGSGTLCCLGATNSSMLSLYMLSLYIIIPLQGHVIFLFLLKCMFAYDILTNTLLIVMFIADDECMGIH